MQETRFFEVQSSSRPTTWIFNFKVDEGAGGGGGLNLYSWGFKFRHLCVDSEQLA